MLKLKRRIAPAPCKGMNPQSRHNKYKLQNNVSFVFPLAKSAHKGLESLSYLGLKIWEILLVEIKQIESLLEFKTKIKNWNPPCCPSRLYKVYFCSM